MSATNAKTAMELVTEAKRRVTNLTPEQVATELAGGDILLVDVREPGERLQNGAISGAVHAPRGMLEFYADPASPYHRPEFDPARRTILYCAAGSRSALAADALRQLGYASVAHLDGGLRGWQEAGRPVEPGGAHV